jgi:transposase InsO family protein
MCQVVQGSRSGYYAWRDRPPSAQGPRWVVRKYKATTNSQHPYPMAEKRLNQQFVADRPHAVWTGDITYVATDEGWLYLATLKDLYTRQIVGWAIDARMTQDLVLRALDQAVQCHQPPWGPAPFLPRQPICRHGIPAATRDLSHGARYESERQLL